MGTWPVSTSVSGYIGTDYQVHAAGSGANTFTWTLAVPAAGTYQAYARWTQHPEPGDQCPVPVNHAGGATVVTQGQPGGGRGQLAGAGRLQLQRRQRHRRLSDEANDYVVADAVMLVPPAAAPEHRDLDAERPHRRQLPGLRALDRRRNRATDAQYHREPRRRRHQGDGEPGGRSR